MASISERATGEAVSALPGYLRVAETRVSADGTSVIFTFRIIRPHWSYWWLMARVAPGVAWHWFRRYRQIARVARAWMRGAR